MCLICKDIDNSSLEHLEREVKKLKREELFKLSTTLKSKLKSIEEDPKNFGIKDSLTEQIKQTQYAISKRM